MEWKRPWRILSVGTTHHVQKSSKSVPEHASQVSDDDHVRILRSFADDVSSHSSVYEARRRLKPLFDTKPARRHVKVACHSRKWVSFSFPQLEHQSLTFHNVLWLFELVQAECLTKMKQVVKIQVRIWFLPYSLSWSIAEWAKPQFCFVEQQLQGLWNRFIDL